MIIKSPPIDKSEYKGALSSNELKLKLNNVITNTCNSWTEQIISYLYDKLPN